MMEFWPFTNFHDLNLDWIIKKIRSVEDSEAAAKASEEAAADSASAASASMGMALFYRNQAKDYRDDAQGFANDASDEVDSIRGVVDQVNTNTGRIDNLVANAGDTDNNAELLDIRVGYDGTVYPTAGDAVRTQVEMVDKDLEYMVGEVFPPFTLTWNAGGYITNSGIASGNSHYTDFFDVTDANGYVRSPFRVKKPTTNDMVQVCFYYDDETRVGTVFQVQNGFYQDITAPEGAAKCRISAPNAVYQNVTIAEISEPVTNKLENLDRKFDGMLETSWFSGGYVNSGGNITTNINNHYSDYVDITNNGLTPGMLKIEKPTVNDWVPYAFYNENDSFISYGIVQATLSESITVPAGAAKVRISAHNNIYNSVYLYSNIQNVVYDYVASASRIGANVTMEMDGNDLVFTSELSGRTMTLSAEKENTRVDANPVFTFIEYRMNGALFKTANDDVTPIRVQQSGSSATYIGAGHGFSNGLRLETSNEKSESDIGSVWKDAADNEFVIYNVGTGYVKVVNPTVTTITSPLTHVSGADDTTAITFSSSSMDFILPAINRHSLKILFADGIEIPGDGTYHDKYFDIVESYDIVDPLAVINYLKQNVGLCTNESVADTAIQSLCKMNLVYRITKGCACTVYQSIDSIENVEYIEAGLVQSQPIGQYAYVPDAFNNNIQYVTGTTLNIGKSNWNNQSKAPYRYYQFSDSVQTKGFFLGYYPKTGLAVNANRIQKCTNAGMFYTSNKMYPYLINNTTVNSGETVEAISFRTPIIKRNDGSLAVTFNYVNDKIIMCIDFQAAFNGYIDLIDDCVGKNIEIIDKTTNCTMTREIASSTKLPVKFTGKGYAVLEFS